LAYATKNISGTYVPTCYSQINLPVRICGATHFQTWLGKSAKTNCQYDHTIFIHGCHLKSMTWKISN